MPKQNPSIRIVMLFIALLTTLTSCALVDNHSAFLQDYEAQYRKAHPYTTHAVPRAGGTIHVREFGSQHQGAPILLMHGFPDSLHLYDRVMPLLAAKRRVIAFDFIGWGESSKPAAHVYDANSLLADLDAVIQYFSLDHVVLVAHDISGYPAIDWALQQPKRVDNLVLLNSIYNPMPSVVLPEAIALFSSPGIMRDIRRWGANQSDSLWQRGVADQTSRFFSNANIRDTYVKIFAQQALAIRPAFFGFNAILDDEVQKRGDVVTAMQAYQQPVTIIFGGDDPYLNTAVAKDFDAIFPHSRLTIIEGAGHYVQLDNPSEVSRLMLESLSDH